MITPRARTQSQERVTTLGRRSSRYVGALIIVMAGVLVYANSLSGPFIFDDIHSIRDNPTLDRWSLAHSLSYNRGVVLSTFWMNRQLFGTDVTAYHVTNMAIHVTAALALSGLLRLTLRQGSLRHHFGRHADWIALVVGLVWLVHPLQTQAVTYTTQRYESLMGSFCLLGLYALARTGSSVRPALWYLLSFVFVLLGLRSKEAMVIMPVMYLWYDYVFLTTGWRHLWRRGWFCLC